MNHNPAKAWCSRANATDIQPLKQLSELKFPGLQFKSTQMQKKKPKPKTNNKTPKHKKGLIRPKSSQDWEEVGIKYQKYGVKKTVFRFPAVETKKWVMTAFSVLAVEI